MRFQSTQSTCGPSTVANLCMALDLPVDEKAVTGWIDRVKRSAEPQVEGTDESQLLRAINEGAPKKHKLRARGWTAGDAAVAIPALRGLLLEGHVAALSVDLGEHWVGAVGISGRRVLVADSAHPELVLSYSPEQLRARWEMTTEPPSFFAIVVWQEVRR